MVNLKRYELNFDKTFAYVNDNLNETNTLSTELINLIDWKSGRFFAFLPKTIEEKDLHSFHSSRNLLDRNKVRNFILEELKKDKQLTCLFDYFSGTYEPVYDKSLFQIGGLFYQKEVYYAVTTKIASVDIMQRCFFVSNTLWHSLCVLSKIDLNNKQGKELTLPEIRNICRNTTLVVVGAYDAEGYIMWESSENKHSSVTELNDNNERCD